jgi:tRNA 2-thiouridine synthesizing protein A
MTALDCRGLSCPEPVYRTRTALAGLAPGGTMEILVDSVTSRENVLRAIRAMGCDGTASEAEDGFRLTVTRPG